MSKTAPDRASPETAGPDEPKPADSAVTRTKAATDHRRLLAEAEASREDAARLRGALERIRSVVLEALTDEQHA